MANEIQKWIPIETRIAELRRCQLARRHGVAQRQSVERRPVPDVQGNPGDVLDLPRICAVHDKPYTSRYICGACGHFEYAQSIQVTELLYLSQYAGLRQTGALTSGDLAVETCAWCGASGRGAVECGSCGREICYGKVVRNYFRCRASCKGEGEMKGSARMHTGVVPGLGYDGERGT